MSSFFSVVFKWLVVVWILAFFSTQLWNLAYWLWIFSGFLGLGLTIPTYFWASCSLALNLTATFTSIFLIMICIKIYYMIKWE